MILIGKFIDFFRIQITHHIQHKFFPLFVVNLQNELSLEFLAKIFKTDSVPKSVSEER